MGSFLSRSELILHILKVVSDNYSDFGEHTVTNILIDVKCR